MVRNIYQAFQCSAKLIISISICLILVFVNFLAYQHAYAILHFTQQGERTDKPEGLSLWQKILILFRGINIPKPLNTTTPAEYGLTYEIHRFTVYNDIELEAWYIPNREAKGLILMFHGYAVSKATLLPEAQVFSQMGYDVFLVDFRGSGGSNQYDTSIGFYEADDVAASLKYVQQKLRPDKIIFYGQSMGGVAILRAIAEKEVKAERVIIEAVFDTMVSTVANRFRMMGLPAYPGAHLLVLWGSLISKVPGFKHNPVKYAAQVDCPILIMHGSADERATLAQAQSVFEQVRSEKRFEAFVGVGHESYLVANPEQWQEIIRQFLSE